MGGRSVSKLHRGAVAQLGCMVFSFGYGVWVFIFKLFGAQIIELRYYYKKLECSFSPLKTYFRISAESPGHCGSVSSVAWARKWEYIRSCESAWLARTYILCHCTLVTPSSTRRRGVLYFFALALVILKRKTQEADSCNEELYPREREEKRVYTLLMQRITFVFHVSIRKKPLQWLWAQKRFIKLHGVNCTMPRSKKNMLKEFLCINKCIINILSSGPIRC